MTRSTPTTQATIASQVAIRLANSTLATINTSVIASIAPEGRGVPVHLVAKIVITRFPNSRPQSLVAQLFLNNLRAVLIFE